jgi:hypothetical protein
MQNKGNKKLVIRPRTVEKKFTDERLTSCAGLTSVWDYIQTIGLFSILNKTFTTLVKSNACKISDIQIFMGIILANLSGVNCLCHIERFTKDPLVCKFLCREKGIDEDSFKCHLKDLGMSGAITFK